MSTTVTTPTSPTPPSSRLDAVRRDFFDGLPAQFERLQLGADELRRLQTDRLRRLLATATTRSPFHRRRLTGIDAGTFTLDDLHTLPVMTKQDLMSEFDDVVTDPDLHLDDLNEVLEQAGDTPRLHLDRFVVLATGGSSGTRGVFVADLGEAAQHAASVVRGGLAGMAAMLGWPPPGPAPMTIVAAPTCMHATRALSSIFFPGRLADVTHAPVTAPLASIVDIVERSQPLILVGYASVVAQLADAHAAGGLSISPVVVSVTSEQLTDDLAERITTGLGVAPTNSYGTSEGLMGTAAPASDVFEFASENVFVEFVDADDRPVGAGETADHVLITNLCNHTQPLIRYRLDDRMTPAPPAETHGHQRASLEGRNDELLDLGGVRVHPITVRSPLVAEPAVGDYQVRVHPDRSIELDVVPAAPTIDLGRIEASITSALARSGAEPGPVRVRIVDRLPRDARTGKTRRFVTVSPGPGGPTSAGA